jgi:hypothetical protein
MKAQAKSTKSQSQSQSNLASGVFGKWLRSIPKSSNRTVTLQPPVSLTQNQWAMLAVEAARQGIGLDDLLQNSIDTFVGMVEEDVAKAA